jgi:2-oxo-4-hydroxy-4-carboxy--5-ureidoimidazoline (OHCU) decarboxylase
VLDLPGELARAFEGAGPLIARLRQESGFLSNEEFLARARAILDAMPESEQIAVINAHPRIGERPETMSMESVREQGATQPETFLRLASLNDDYEQKFGFRFVVFVNRRSTEALLPVLESRLRGSRDEERRTALAEILAIAADRLKTCSPFSS